ncbi:MAG TPA: hypothetical protein VEF89_23290 [Solirubrobacteraceae bacterium]|nr:hypothetical protein [Solirubrobacteraceae bacterium]
MSFELAKELQAALRDGSGLADLEALLLARGESPDEIAAAWLYAWAYEALRPWPDDLAAQITHRCVPGQTSTRRRAADRIVARGELQTSSRNSGRFPGGSSPVPHSRRRSRTAWNSAPKPSQNGPFEVTP